LVWNFEGVKDRGTRWSQCVSRFWQPQIPFAIASRIKIVNRSNEPDHDDQTEKDIHSEDAT